MHMPPQDALLATLFAAVVLLATSLQPSLASRASQHLWPGARASASNDDAAFACGFFNTSDPVDGGIAHQPCYGLDGTVQFCCLSGSSKCSCPASFSSGYGCYNYESDSPLNAVTGEECGYFFPDESAEQASTRRLLQTCTGTNPYKNCRPDTSGATYGTCTTVKPLIPLLSFVLPGNPNTLACTYGTFASQIVCLYNATSGALTPVSSTSSCCPTTSTC